LGLLSALRFSQQRRKSFGLSDRKYEIRRQAFSDLPPRVARLSRLVGAVFVDNTKTRDTTKKGTKGKHEYGLKIYGRNRYPEPQPYTHQPDTATKKRNGVVVRILPVEMEIRRIQRRGLGYSGKPRGGENADPDRATRGTSMPWSVGKWATQIQAPPAGENQTRYLFAAKDSSSPRPAWHRKGLARLSMRAPV